MATPNHLTPAGRELLYAVRAGYIAWRYHLTCGWAIRRTDRRSKGPGGGMGSNVTAAVTRLEKRGLVTCDRDQTRYEDQPYRLTDVGLVLLDPQTVAERDAEQTPTLPMADDGREPFRAGENDAPSGAVLDLGDNPDTPGYWQRQGHEWVPVDEHAATAVNGAAEVPG